MSNKGRIEIDYCPKCRGVWLDRGELDKIIEESTSYQPERTQQYAERPTYSDDYHAGGYKKKKKENFLGDLFDF